MSAADDNPLTLVHVLSNRIGRAFYGEVEARFGITLAEWRVLLTLAREPGLSAAEVTNHWAMEKMAVNRAIRRLLDDGLLRRRRSRDDGRLYLLSLTPKGRRLYERVLPAANARYHDLVSSLSRSERDALETALRKMIERADALPGPP